jgi:signal transduction histidine kinase
VKARPSSPTVPDLVKHVATGRAALATLVVSVLYLAFAFASAALTPYEVNPKNAWGAAFICLASLLEAGLVAMFLLRDTRALLRLAVAQACFLAVYAWLHPENAFDALLVIPALILPFSIYERYPRNLIGSGILIIAFFALRIFFYPAAAPGYAVKSYLGLAASIAFPALTALLGSFLAGYRREIDRLNAALLEVTKLNLSYQDYTMNVEAQSMLSERLRLTRDIHDIVGYALTNAIMMMEAGKIMARSEPGKLPDFIEMARSNTEQALNQVRDILRNLRRKEIQNVSGPNAIMKMIRVFETATSIKVAIDFGNYAWDLEEQKAFVVYHFIQESMLNAFRHGQANRVDVYFWKDENDLIVNVRDDGAGAKALAEGIGISGMRERLEKVGGKLTFGNTADGFGIAIRIPLGGEADER